MALLKVIGTWLLLCDSYVLNDLIPDQWLNAICFPLDMQIQQANSTAYHAAMQISDSLEKLKLVKFVREKVESDLGDTFQTLYRNNSMRLEEISKINEILQALVKEAEIIGEQANGNLTMAVENANRSKDLAGQRKREAQSALDNATNAHSDTLQASGDANNALKTAMGFKVSKSFESSCSFGASSLCEWYLVQCKYWAWLSRCFSLYLSWTRVFWKASRSQFSG